MILNFSAKPACGKSIPYIGMICIFCYFVCLLLFTLLWTKNTWHFVFSVKMSEQKFEIENSQAVLFECYICNQKFDQYALEVHFVTAHNKVQNENIIKCEICEKSFETGKMRTHIKTVHNDGHKDFKCDTCGKLVL